MTELPEKISLDVVTPRGRVVSLEVDEVVLPGSEGYFGVRPGHTPLLAGLGIGVLSWKAGNVEGQAAVATGYAEVLPGSVSVLAETAEMAAEIDEERARAARERAEERLARLGDPDVNLDRARAALMRAETRLRVRGAARA